MNDRGIMGGKELLSVPNRSQTLAECRMSNLTNDKEERKTII